MTYRLGFDIGGTFTDLVLLNLQTGSIYVNKVLTTPEHPEQAVLEGLRELLGDARVAASEVELAIHGTTLITNALIERSGAKTALLTTSGYRDVLEIGTEMRYDTYDLRLTLPTPLVPRHLRYEVRGRVDAAGRVIEPLNESDVLRALKDVASSDVEAVAISFLHSFREPAHEQRAVELTRNSLPNVAISASSAVAPEIREYPRTSTTVANAFTQPISALYFDRMIGGLKEAGYDRRLYVMLSSGGVATAESARDFPIRILESGPAGGVAAASFLGKALSEHRVMAFDMGGTTAKLSLLPNGQPIITSEAEVARERRFKPGSGLPIRVPMIEMIEIGAGGGSIAHADRLGLLKVGPESAGAMPGPACYGLGGSRATVTDANLLLGYLDVESFLGGRMRLDRQAAEDSMRPVGARLGLSVEETAQGIFRVVNENMIAAAKIHIAEHGQDSRRYVLIAFGGAGPIHAHSLAAALRIPTVVYPASAGVLSAFGFLTAPVSFEYSRSLLTELTDDSTEALQSVFSSMQEEGRATLVEAGVSEDSITYSQTADMRYLGQSRELNVHLPSASVALLGSGAVRDIFATEYARNYGHAHPEVPVQIVTCRLVASGPAPRIHLAQAPNEPDSVDRALKGTRTVWFDADGGDWATARVYDRYRLAGGAVIDGPAVVEERESTVVVPPGARVTVDATLNLILHQQSER